MISFKQRNERKEHVEASATERNHRKVSFFNFYSLELSGCTTFNKSQVAAPYDIKIVSTLKADIVVDMSKKLSGTASASTLFGIIDISGPERFANGVFAAPNSFFSMGTGPAELKAAAAYNAVSGKADVLVAPQHVVQKKSYLVYPVTTVAVTGYAGMIKKSNRFHVRLAVMR